MPFGVNPSSAATFPSNALSKNSEMNLVQCVGNISAFLFGIYKRGVERNRQIDYFGVEVRELFSETLETGLDKS